MSSHKRLCIVLMLASAFISKPQAMDEGCIYESNKDATTLIEYTCVLADGDGNCDSSGTGFIISESGLVLTNNHVISPGDNIKVVSETINIRVGGLFKSPVTASVISRDKATDLAILRLPPRPNGEKWQTVAIGTTENLPVGAPLMGLGFSQSDLAIIPSGMKTAHNTYVDKEIKPWWQTNLALNHGNSGGPIFGSSGTVIGMSVAYNKADQLVSYIIPIYYADHYLNLADVEKFKYSKCAAFPECRNKLHGIERYAVDEVHDRWGEWRSGGYNRPAFCNDLLSDLKSKYPNSEFVFLGDNEESQNIVRVFSYRYYCKFRRLEQPIYKLSRTEFCLQ